MRNIHVSDSNVHVECKAVAKKVEALVNCFGERKSSIIAEYGVDFMKYLSFCLVRQFARETEADYRGYHGAYFMADGRNEDSLATARKLMQDEAFRKLACDVTPWFETLSKEELFKTYDCYDLQLQNMQEKQANETQCAAGFVAYAFINNHKTLQQNLFRCCYAFLKDEGFVSDEAFLPYI